MPNTAQLAPKSATVVWMSDAGTGVLVGVAVGGSGVLVAVAVGGTGVLVAVAVGKTGVLVGVGAVASVRPTVTLWSTGVFNPSPVKLKRYSK